MFRVSVISQRSAERRENTHQAPLPNNGPAGIEIFMSITLPQQLQSSMNMKTACIIDFRPILQTTEQSNQH